MSHERNLKEKEDDQKSQNDLNIPITALTERNFRLFVKNIANSLATQYIKIRVLTKLVLAQSGLSEDDFYKMCSDESKVISGTTLRSDKEAAKNEKPIRIKYGGNVNNT